MLEIASRTSPKQAFSHQSTPTTTWKQDMVGQPFITKTSVAGYGDDKNLEAKLSIWTYQAKRRLFWLRICAISILLMLVTCWLPGVKFFGAFRNTITQGTTQISQPVISTARTDQVQFDNYTLILKGQRIFLHSGEFHTFRLPVPSLWPDILDKFKAAGLNAVSVYTHMGLINPAPGVVDLGGFRALQPLFDAAKANGIWVVLRPGPVSYSSLGSTANIS